MKIYENIEAERDRVEACIKRYGWTSDHSFDWFLDATIGSKSVPIFVEFADGGLLASRYEDEWRIWSDPLSDKDKASSLMAGLLFEVLSRDIRKVWCDDISDYLRPKLAEVSGLRIGEIEYSLEWPVLDMLKYDPLLPGGHFKEIRNAKNKFYREHSVEEVDSSGSRQDDLLKILESWKERVDRKDDYNYKKYINAINNSFKGFSTARVLLVDGRSVGINAGYETVNRPDRFAGVIGIHDYSIKDLGLILWLKDFEWVKVAGYREMDLQGDEGGGLKFKMQFSPRIERRTDTFSLERA